MPVDSINRILLHIPFCVWLLSLSAMLLRVVMLWPESAVICFSLLRSIPLYEGATVDESSYWGTIALFSRYINDMVFHILLCFLLFHVKCLATVWLCVALHAFLATVWSTTPPFTSFSLSTCLMKGSEWPLLTKMNSVYFLTDLSKKLSGVHTQELGFWGMSYADI